MTSESDRSPYHHGNLREALIEASLEILEREGLPGLGLRAVARAAGVSQTAPYHHFDGKEGLLAAVAARGFDMLQREEQRIRSNPALDPEACVRELGVGYVRMARRYPELFKLMFGPTILHREQHPDLVRAYQAGYAEIEKAVRALIAWRHGCAAPEQVAVGVAAAWSTVHGLATLLIDGRLRPGQDAMPDEDELVRTVLHTLTIGDAQPDSPAAAAATGARGSNHGGD